MAATYSNAKQWSLESMPAGVAYTCAEALLCVKMELATFAFALILHQVLSRQHRLHFKVSTSKAKRAVDELPVPLGKASTQGHSPPSNTSDQGPYAFETAKTAEEALQAFRTLPEKRPCLYNKLIEICVGHRDLDTAERAMADATAGGMADVVTYNTIIKAHLQADNLTRARSILKIMRRAGVEPNSRTYNELMDAMVRIDVEGVWALLDDMRVHGVKPTPITTSILLKSVQSRSRTSDIERIMSVVEATKDHMDEVLLSSVIEACIRAARADLLRRPLARQFTSRGVQVQSAHTYGSLIRAHGFVHDVAGAWKTWNQMKAKHISPTSITFGCMVEALVANECPEDAHVLIQEALGDSQTRPLVNSVTYCSVLKGLSHLKRFDRVWAVYQEMLQEEMPLSVAAYNAILDACARCGEISRAPALLDDMVRQGAEPNLITYSSILKGYCQDNKLDKALELMEHMKGSSRFRPDEITYNTLLDGCARQGLYDRGMLVLADMESAGVRPTNFTLSVLVKLANRGRRIERCFELAEALPRKYNFRPNVHVYNNLIQACVNHKDLPRALTVLEGMARQQPPVRPDSRTVTLLLRGCLSAGLPEDCASLLRFMLGLSVPAGGLLSVSRLEESVLRMQSREFSTELLSEVIEGIARQCHREDIALKLHADLTHVQGLALDHGLPARLAARRR